MTDIDSLNRLVNILGGWPRHFGAAEKKHGLSLLAFMRRDKIIDEPSFGIVIRYATHRAAWDRLSQDIKTEVRARQPGDDSYMSGAEQERAYHFNKLAQIEKQLLATPYERARSDRDVQTSFMSQLEPQPIERGGDNKVTPMRPLTRPARA